MTETCVVVLVKLYRLTVDFREKRLLSEKRGGEERGGEMDTRKMTSLLQFLPKGVDYNDSCFFLFSFFFSFFSFFLLCVFTLPFLSFLIVKHCSFWKSRNVSRFLFLKRFYKKKKKKKKKTKRRFNFLDFSIGLISAHFDHCPFGYASSSLV